MRHTKLVIGTLLACVACAAVLPEASRILHKSSIGEAREEGATLDSQGTHDTAKPVTQVRSELPIVSDQIVISASDALAKRLNAQPDKVTSEIAKSVGRDLAFVRSALPGVFVFRLRGRPSRATLDDVMGRLARFPGIKSVEEDLIMYPVGDVLANDPMLGSQWMLSDTAPSALSVTKAWSRSIGAGVTVAVLDTGITDHPDLDGNVLPGYNFIRDEKRALGIVGPDAHDNGDWVTEEEASPLLSPFHGCRVTNSSWHGTHVSGIIAANMNNGTGIAGIAPGAKILPVRVLGKCGGYSTDVAMGIYWASGAKQLTNVPANPNPAQVLNMSLAAPGACPSYYAAAIAAAKQAGAVIVAAAGNSNTQATSFTPASCSGVITVASVGKMGNRAYYSNYGSKVTLAAPGGDASADSAEGTVLGTLNTGTTSPSSPTYGYMQGTSMAAPMVSATIALTIASRPKLSAGSAADIVLHSVTPFPTDSECLLKASRCGSGMLNADRAVAYAADAGIDLVVSKVHRQDDAIIPGVPTKVIVRVENAGELSAVGEAIVRVMLKADSPTTENLLPLAEVTTHLDLVSKAFKDVQFSEVTIPVSSVPDGEYTLIGRVIPTTISEKPSATENNDTASSTVKVAMPRLAVTRKTSQLQTPALVRYAMTVEPIEFARLLSRKDFVKSWLFDGIAPAKVTTIPSITYKTTGTHTATAKISHPSGLELSATDSVVTTDPEPFKVTVARKFSNAVMRAPVSVRYLAQISGGHPNDKVKTLTWKIDDTGFTEKSSPIFSNMPAGPHTVTLSMTSAFGYTTVVKDGFTVVANQPPICSVSSSHEQAKRVVTFIAKCSDNDGRVRAYEWTLDGQRSSSSTNIMRYSYASGWHGTVVARAIATDDSGDQTATESTFSLGTP